MYGLIKPPFWSEVPGPHQRRFKNRAATARSVSVEYTNEFDVKIRLKLSRVDGLLVPLKQAVHQE